MATIKVGLKANAAFLFKAMKGNNQGGMRDSILHTAIIYVNNEQFEYLKEVIAAFGYSINKSLVISDEPDIDYSCYLVK